MTPREACLAHFAACGLYQALGLVEVSSYVYFSTRDRCARILLSQGCVRDGLGYVQGALWTS
jgi:hypothetical protein